MGSEKATPRTRTPNASCSHAPPASPTSGVGTSPLDAAVLRDALPGVLGVRRSPAGLKLCRRRHRALLGAGLEPGPGACASHTPASVLRMRHPPRPSGVNHSGPSPPTLSARGPAASPGASATPLSLLGSADGLLHAGLRCSWQLCCASQISIFL